MRLSGAVVALLVASSAVFGASISANGTCEVGNCTTPDVVSPGHDSTTPFGFDYTFSNGDQYRITGNLIVQYLETSQEFFRFDVPSSVTYLGTALSQADSLTLRFEQGFAIPSLLAGNYVGAVSDVSGSFIGSFGVGTQVQYQDHVGVDDLLLGPFYPAQPFSETVTDQPYVLSSPSTTVNSTYMFTFGAGTETGASISAINEPSSAPEPGSWLLLSCGLAVVGWRIRSKNDA